MGLESWFCCGDFNEMLNNAEKSSGPARPLSQMGDFQNYLEDCGQQDLGFSRPRYTWCNRRSGQDFSCERLDRAVANHRWTCHFNVVQVLVLPRNAFDHNPLMLVCDWLHSI